MSDEQRGKRTARTETHVSNTVDRVVRERNGGDELERRLDPSRELYSSDETWCHRSKVREERKGEGEGGELVNRVCSARERDESSGLTVDHLDEVGRVENGEVRVEQVGDRSGVHHYLQRPDCVSGLRQEARRKEVELRGQD